MRATGRAGCSHPQRCAQGVGWDLLAVGAAAAAHNCCRTALRHAVLRCGMLQVALGGNPALERHFGCVGPFWSRQYLFWHDGAPLTLIHEVFSSSLEAYLGPSSSSSSSSSGSSNRGSSSSSSSSSREAYPGPSGNSTHSNVQRAEPGAQGTPHSRGLSPAGGSAPGSQVALCPCQQPRPAGGTAQQQVCSDGRVLFAELSVLQRPKLRALRPPPPSAHSDVWVGARHLSERMLLHA